MLLQRKAHVKSYDDKTKWTDFLDEDELFLSYYRKIWDIADNNIKKMLHSNKEEDFYDNINKTNYIFLKRFDSDPIYNNKYIKTKLNSYNGETRTNFHDEKIPEEGFHYVCLSMILIHSVFKKGDKYYPQVFLEECKYIIKEKKKEVQIYWKRVRSFF